MTVDYLLKSREAAELYRVPRMVSGGECSYCKRMPAWGQGCDDGQPGIRPDADLSGWIKGDICPDCGADLGQYHHFGCDLAMCPDCKGQLYYGCTCKE